VIHHAASEGFSADPAAYDRARPDYPLEAVRWLLDRLAVGPDDTVVDLGAGTGKLTEHLLRSGATVIAVEPVPEMRAALARKLPSVKAVDAVAERLPFARGSADAVVAGQAFHWFDQAEALPEIHRILRSGGHLGLVWNRRRLEQPLQAAISELVEPYRASAPAHGSGAWQRGLDASSLFRLEEAVELGHEQRLDRRGFVDRVGSISFIAALPDAERRRVLDAARELTGSSAEVSLAYVAEVFSYVRSDEESPNSGGSALGPSG
jgi:SAM-dependent methyltransferase